MATVSSAASDLVASVLQPGSFRDSFLDLKTDDLKVRYSRLEGQLLETPMKPDDGSSFLKGHINKIFEEA